MLWAFLENLKAVDLSCEETYSLALLNSTRCIGQPYFLNLQVEILLTCGVKHLTSESLSPLVFLQLLN